MNFEILKELTLYSPINKKIRLGREEDGGYVIVDGYDYDCFISVGTANEVSFEVAFAEKYQNIPSIAFDGTTDRPDRLSENIDYVKKFVGTTDSEKTTNLINYVKDYDDVFIKMDIEGAEWAWIKSFKDSLKRVGQITFEAHAIFPDKLSAIKKKAHCQGLSLGDFQKSVLEGLRILNESHYLVHVYENNRAQLVDIGDTKCPDFLILTFIRKDYGIDGLNTERLPINGIDFPCYKSVPPLPFDINAWPFVFSKE